MPNETLVTTTVLNHSYSSQEIRIAMQVQVAYDSDVEKALSLLTQIALREPRVLRDSRAPASFLVSFADSGITLELGVWIDSPHGQLGLKSAINRAIFREFAANGIEIPYPRRDVRIVGPVPVETVAARTGCVPGTRRKTLALKAWTPPYHRGRSSRTIDRHPCRVRRPPPRRGYLSMEINELRFPFPRRARALPAAVVGLRRRYAGPDARHDRLGHNFPAPLPGASRRWICIRWSRISSASGSGSPPAW